MVLDGHVHIMSREKNREDFERNLQAAGVDGCIVNSLPPAAFGIIAKPTPAEERLENLLFWTETSETLFPFYWVDPIEDDALVQVKLAVERGVAGFKVICSRHDPGDPRAMKVYAAIAEAHRPILFHSGILWDGKPSSHHCRPVLFEPLMEVPHLRFALAHVSWPWCDECIAVYGKFLSNRSRRPELTSEMFIDTTPGTPPIYRREVLTKLFTVGYDIENNVIFGSDCRTKNYNARWTREWIERDRKIFDELGLPKTVQEQVFAGNLRRFVGASASAEK